MSDLPREPAAWSQDNRDELDWRSPEPRPVTSSGMTSEERIAASRENARALNALFDERNRVR